MKPLRVWTDQRNPYFCQILFMPFRLLILAGVFLITLSSGQSNKNEYQYTIDLTQVVDDKLFVELKVPAITASEITFFLPKIIPGTYSIEDYGRYVSDLKALDKKGKSLEVEKTSTNAWKIKNASKLTRITYWVDDTYDTDKGAPEIFQPAGTNIEANKNILMNNSGFFGYFEGVKDVPFVLKVIRDKSFYGSTGLIAETTGASIATLQKEKPENTNKRVDVYRTGNYDELVDSPLMYAQADTAIIRVGNTEVLIGSFSPNKKITAKEIASTVREVLLAQRAFLGGQLPVNKYAFIFYWTDKPVNSYGALEHSYSSVYYMPEATIQETGGQLRDFAAHEFFHIVTPLTIHSEEIHRFDFNDPKMSKHLWLYEGVTEYFAGSVQVKYGLITVPEYLNDMRQKMVAAENFLDDVPFTDISKFTLDKYANQYINVYQKGALIGLCLDVKLRNLSGGKYGMQNLVADLSKKYGKQQAFKDDELFDQITALTYPEIGEFFKRYVGGAEKLPLTEVFESVGVTYMPEQSLSEFSIGLENRGLQVIQYQEEPKLGIGNPEGLNDQGKALHFNTGDIIMKINGEEMPKLGPALQGYIEKIKGGLKEGGTLTYTVLRKDEAGALKEITLEAPVKKVDRKRKHALELNPGATPEQLALRAAWLSTR
jgi:predicted metalloprotease with PDZ domain